MVIDERMRHRLYLRLEEVLGGEEASVLMGHLPPVGWADVATKRDLDQLEDRFRVRFDSVGHQMQALEQELIATFRGELRQALLAMAGLMITLTGLVFAASRLG